MIVRGHRVMVAVRDKSKCLTGNRGGYVLVTGLSLLVYIYASSDTYVKSVLGYRP